jgi:hypothetical protein
MTTTNTNITGIQNPATFNLDMLQAGAIRQPKQDVTGIQTSPQRTTMDLQDDLATIRALNVAQPQSGGAGQTVGGLLGAGAGTAIGGPGGGTVGGAVGQTVGSVVDYMIDKDARDKAEEKRKEAIKKEIERQKAIENSRAIAASKAHRIGIGLTREQAAMTEGDVINNMRRDMLKNLLSSINQKAQGDEVLKQKFLKSRRIV